MGRRNSPRSLAVWEANKVAAPYRASVGAFYAWDVGLPPPRLIVASKISPGGRALLAFKHAEIRDYFVAGHAAENGAQVEPDGAERASRGRRAKPVAEPAPASLDEAITRFQTARAAHEAAEKRLREVFEDEAMTLIGEGRIVEAIAIINAMPDTVMKTMCLSKLKEVGYDFKAQPLHAIDPAETTPAQAKALLDWWLTKGPNGDSEDVMGAMLRPLADDCVARKDEEGLRALLAKIPACVSRAFLSLRLRDLMKGHPNP